MKPIFTRIIATAETTEQAAAAIKIVMDNIRYIDRVEFIKDNGFIMVYVRIKSNTYKIKSYKKEWRKIIKYVNDHNWLYYDYINSFAFCNPEKYEYTGR